MITASQDAISFQRAVNSPLATWLKLISTEAISNSRSVTRVRVAFGRRLEFDCAIRSSIKSRLTSQCLSDDNVPTVWDNEFAECFALSYILPSLVTCLPNAAVLNSYSFERASFYPDPRGDDRLR